MPETSMDHQLRHVGGRQMAARRQHAIAAGDGADGQVMHIRGEDQRRCPAALMKLPTTAPCVFWVGSMVWA